MQDETMLLQDHAPKRGSRSPGNQRVLQIYFDHLRWVIYGTISYSHQYFLQEKKFNGSTSLKFVKKLLERSNKAVIAMGATSQHRTKEFKEFVKENRHRLRIMYLSTGCPELSAIEERWRHLTIQTFMYEYHEHVSGCTRTVMKYLRTTVFN